MTLALYGNSLHAGIMFDAALDLPRATERSWLEILSSAGPSPYFRPVTLLIWKACYELLGRNDFTVLHAISLASHMVCGWLVYQVGRRLAGPLAGAAAAALFLWFPLNYQVVAFVDSLFHSVAALWVLAAAVLYWDARVRGGRLRTAAALVCGGLALLTHEGTAALLTPLAVGIELLAAPKRSWRPAAFALETAAFLGIWLAVPRWPSTPRLDLPSLQLNAAYFFQALGYPATQLLARLPRPGIGDALEAVLASAVVLVLLLLLARARGRLPVALFGLLWFGAAVAIPCALLPWPNYVIDAPRLLYGASAGIAVLWAAALAPHAPSHARAAGRAATTSLVGNLAGGLALLAILAQSAAFVGLRERLLDEGAALVGQVMASATKAGPEAGRLYVNVPAFLGPTGGDFLLGHSGVTMLPDYFGLDLEVAAATGQRLPVRSVAVDDLARPWEAAYGFQGQHAGAGTVQQAGGGVYVTRFEPGRLRLDYVGSVLPAGGGPAKASFGGWAAIDDASAVRQGSQLSVRLTWRSLAPAPGDYTVFVHVVGSGPQPLVQSDGYPVAGLLSPRDWPAGLEVRDVRQLELPAAAQGGPLSVLVGLYDRASPTVRASATDSGGARLADDALVIPVAGGA
jgi:hypothetical protein